MNNQIIDVEYKEIEPLENKKTEELAAEANILWEQMEAIGNVGLMLAAQAGRRLLVVKDRCAHGEFENWCEENLKFSTRKANRMMKLATKMNDENSLFSNPTTLADIGISKVWELLSAPEEVAEQVVNNPEMQEASVREFKDEIKRIKDELEKEKALTEELHGHNIEAQKDIIAYRERIETLEEELGNQPVRDSSEIEAKEKEIQSLKEKLEKEKEKLTKEKEKLKTSESDKEKQIEEAVSKAIENAKKEAIAEAEAGNQAIKTKFEEAQETIARLERNLANNQNKEIAAFKVKADMLQECFNSCLQSISTVGTDDPETADKMKIALKTIMEQLLREV